MRAEQNVSHKQKRDDTTRNCQTRLHKAESNSYNSETCAYIFNINLIPHRVQGPETDGASQASSRTEIQQNIPRSDLWSVRCPSGQLVCLSRTINLSPNMG